MPKIVVIGGANVDIKGRTSGPAIMGTSNPGTASVSAGGVGRNIAHNLALLGLDVALVAMVGTDANAKVIEQQSRAAGIDTSLLQTIDGPSGTYLALLAQDGELISAINAMGCADAMTPAMLQVVSNSLAAADFLVADCNIPVACLAWLSAFAVHEGKRLLIEPVSVPKVDKLKRIPDLHAFAITPNRDQLLALTGTRDVAEAARTIHAMGLANCMILAGAEGAYVSIGGEAPTQVNARPIAPVSDVTGAGDAAVAGLVWGLVSGYDMVQSARFGQAAAALKLASAQSVAEGLSAQRLLALAN